MWIQRTPAEASKWRETTAAEARSHGRLIGGMVWVLVSALAAGGWMVSFRAGYAVQQGASGSFWSRLPIVAAVLFPLAWLLCRFETKKELAKLTARTVCPKCETTRDGQEGAACECGGTIISQSTVKWVDAEDKVSR